MGEGSQIFAGRTGDNSHWGEDREGQGKTPLPPMFSVGTVLGLIEKNYVWGDGGLREK